MKERESDRRMKSQSPPKHRHDGSSPLPLGMDWSPPSKNWNGQEVVGPYDSRTGWSYWVTVPSWDVRPISKNSDRDVDSSVHVFLRSPEGITKTRCVRKKLRDFMKLMTDLQNKFPSNKVVRRLGTRFSLNKEWITKLLSDIDLSRSLEVASFLELVAAACAFHSEDQDVNPQNSEANSHEMPTQSNLPAILGSSSINSDYASDTAYGRAEPGTPRIRKDENSEIDVNVVGKDVHVSRLGGAEASSSMVILGNLDLCGSGDAQLFLLLDMVKTDVKYLEARLKQETAVRIYHEAKIKEFEAEKEIDGQNIKKLKQALATETDKKISLWQTSLKMKWELEAKSEKEKRHLLRELSSIKEQQENVSKQYKTKKADCKVLVGEVKRLRHELQNLEKKLLQQEKLNIKQAEDANERAQHQLELFDLLKNFEDQIGVPLTEVTKALRKAGLGSSNLILGIDFTKSNEWTGKASFNNRSLHALGNTLNPCEKAISIIGKTLAPFNERNLIYCFGFGEATTLDQEVFSFRENNSPCHGFDEVLSRYRKLVPDLKPAGPTSYAPIVDAAIQIVEKSSGQYHVLVIITDGQVTRNVVTRKKELSQQEKETIRSIASARSYPLSIILVGVGDGPWENIKKLDRKNRRQRFHNFQFVNFNDNARESTSSPYEAAFARDALMKIPDQFKAAKKLELLGKTTGTARKVFIRSPPVQYSHPLLSDIPASPLANDKDSEPHKLWCPVCLESGVGTAFNCGHMVCEVCEPRLSKCPICRKEITSRLRVYP